MGLEWVLLPPREEQVNQHRCKKQDIVYFQSQEGWEWSQGRGGALPGRDPVDSLQGLNVKEHGLLKEQKTVVRQAGVPVC